MREGSLRALQSMPKDKYINPELMASLQKEWEEFFKAQGAPGVSVKESQALAEQMGEVMERIEEEGKKKFCLARDWRNL